MSAPLPQSALALTEGGKPRWQVLLEKAGAALREGEIVTAPTYEFIPLNDQPRTYFGVESMRRMVESLKGPLGQVYEGIGRLAPPGSRAKYQIIDGERRWRGARAAEMTYRSRIIEVDDETVPYIIAAVANFNREGHTVPDTVNSIMFFLELGMPWKEIARAMNMTLQWTQKLATLKSLRTDVWDMLDPNQVKSKILPTSAAFEIAQLPPNLQLRIAQKVVAQKLTMAATRHEVSETAATMRIKLPRVKREPRKTWRSISNRGGVLQRQSTDLLRALEDPDFEEILDSQDVQLIYGLLQQLELTNMSVRKALRLLYAKKAAKDEARS